MKAAIICRNRNLSGMKQILTLLVLFFTVGGVLFPVILSQFIIDYQKENGVIFCGVFLMVLVPFLIALLCIGVKKVWGRVLIIPDDGGVRVEHRCFGWLLKETYLPFRTDSRLAFTCGTAASNAFIFRGHLTRTLSLVPVEYCLELRDSLACEAILKSGNKDLLDSVFCQLCTCYPKLESCRDLSGEQVLRESHQRQVLAIKKRMAGGSALVLFFGLLMMTPIMLIEYQNFKKEQDWVPVQGYVAEMMRTKGAVTECIIAYEHRGERRLTEAWPAHQLGIEPAIGTAVRLYVHPQNAERYSFGRTAAMWFYGGFCLWLGSFVLAFFKYIAYRKQAKKY